MAKKKKPKAATTVSFEESFDELQQIVAQLEEGKLSLNDSLEQYEQGIKRLRECYHALATAETKIRQLVDLDDDGNLTMRDFESETASAAKRKSANQDSVDSDNSLF